MSGMKWISCAIAAALLCACATTETSAARKDRPLRIAPDYSGPRPTGDSEGGASLAITEGREPSGALEEVRSYERNLSVQTAAAPGLHGLELSDSDYWKSPEFRKRFNDSYIAETEVEPTLNLIEKEVMQQYFELLSTDKTAEALALLEQNRGATASAVFDFMAGHELIKAERLEEAAAAYEIATQKHAKFRRAWAALGQCYLRMGDYSKAIAPLTQALRHGELSDFTFSLLGQCYKELQDPIAAESAFRMALLLDPRNDNYKLALAGELAKQGRYADVVAIAGTLLAKDPSRHELWRNQAKAYLELGQPMRAAENLEILERLGGVTAADLALLGDIYIREQLYDLGAQAHVRALALAPDGGVDRALRVVRPLMQSGARDSAARLLDAIEAVPAELPLAQRKDVLRARAKMADMAGATEEQLAALKEIADLDPLDGDALIQLGKHASRTDADLAIFYFERAALIDDFEAEAKVAHGQLLVGQAKYVEALTLLRRAQAIRPRENIQKYIEDVEKFGQTRGQN